MKSIYTLIPDIYAQLDMRGGWFSAAMGTELGNEVSYRIQDQFQDRVRRGLRLSETGKYNCPCALWHAVNLPELAEPIQPWVRNKFCYGHLIEAWAIALAKAAGHTVTGEQDALFVDGITGHRDCVIDGCVVDVKSANSRTFAKFKSQAIAQDDGFGWLDQLDGYLVGSAGDDLVIEKKKAYLFVIDKELGHMVLYEHVARPERVYERIRRAKQIISSKIAPACTCGTSEGSFGNSELNKVSKYNPYKWECFPKLRAFLYADGMHYITKVEKRPAAHIHEMDKAGNILH